jgi:hypothetical protein
VSVVKSGTFSSDGHPVKVISTWWEDEVEFALIRYMDDYVPYGIENGYVMLDESGVRLWEHRVKTGLVVKSGGDYYNPNDWVEEEGLIGR